MRALMPSKSKQAGCLYLIPSTLGPQNIHAFLPNEVIRQIHSIEHFVVEDEKTARHFLAIAKHPRPIRELHFETLNEHTKPSEVKKLIFPLIQGFNVGLVSEAGCPAIADPGADLVKLAQESSIKVIPLVGPSSILLGLMASGLNGQQFAFHGYLPVSKDERISKIKFLESESMDKGQTQIFIETPYRNVHLFIDLLNTCKETTRLCIASNIGCTDERIITKTVKTWRQFETPEINKQPTVFLLLS
jgi:16S rRNA (cytidine1402-2'-O)-methyltransferase